MQDFGISFDSLVAVRSDAALKSLDSIVFTTYRDKGNELYTLLELELSPKGKELLEAFAEVNSILYSLAADAGYRQGLEDSGRFKAVLGLSEVG